MELLNVRLEGKKEELVSVYEKFVNDYIYDYLDKVGAVERLENLLIQYNSTVKTIDTKKITISGVHHCRVLITFYCMDFSGYINDFLLALKTGLEVFYDNISVIYSDNTVKVLFSIPTSSEYLYYSFEDIAKYVLGVLSDFLINISVPF
ncbi:MAG: hypothetical protein ACP5P7_07290 [Sulfurihydrogenibium sp.]